MAHKSFPSWLNAVFVWLQKSDIKGKYWFYCNTHHVFRDFLISHKSNYGRFAVPYEQWCFWKTYGPDGYYLEEMKPFAEAINTHLNEFVFLDLGADVGVVSNLVANHCPKIKQVVAFEPNPMAFDVLQQNAENSSLSFLPKNKAISNYNGHATLQFDESVSSDHEGYITPQENGNTVVVTLDQELLKESDAFFDKNIALKVDVEGQERQVFEGAKVLLQKCNKAVVLLEIHPDTLQRDDMSPEDLFIALESIRACRWEVPLLDKPVDRNTPFFEQFERQQYDVIAYID